MTIINGTLATGQTTATLESIRENILARLAEITSEPKPSYNIDGQDISWQEYKDSLFNDLKLIDERLAADREPFEVVSQGIT